jgi:hypothetical protein
MFWKKNSNAACRDGLRINARRRTEKEKEGQRCKETLPQKKVAALIF